MLWEAAMLVDWALRKVLRRARVMVRVVVRDIMAARVVEIVESVEILLCD